jgi:3-methyladenine DNA glycosylase Tag
LENVKGRDRLEDLNVDDGILKNKKKVNFTLEQAQRWR